MSFTIKILESVLMHSVLYASGVVFAAFSYFYLHQIVLINTFLRSDRHWRGSMCVLFASPLIEFQYILTSNLFTVYCLFVSDIKN